MLADLDKLLIAKAQIPALAAVHENPDMGVPAVDLVVPFHLNFC